MSARRSRHRGDAGVAEDVAPEEFTWAEIIVRAPQMAATMARYLDQLAVSARPATVGAYVDRVAVVRRAQSPPPTRRVDRSR